MNEHFQQFRKQITKPSAFKLYTLRHLPAAYFAGLRIELLEETKAIVSVKQKWFNKNPFHSIYFAVLSMAAELSTGVLCMGNIYKRKPSVSMLITEQKGVFHKKATGTIIFVCDDGNKIATAVEDAMSTKMPVTVSCYSRGLNSKEELVSEFWITWSLKVRNV
ncbi:MAG TPA: DUF4442 domain-containing protein [Parafilimonas sp.]|nr:DUF4442 domain-containing protein [Parafilimonas sp.]